MKLITVIDDDRDILDVVEFVLELEGFQVQTSQSGGYLQQMQNSFPDLIILDVHLGDEDGRDICQNVKTNTCTQHIPIILFSAIRISHEALKVTCADGFLPKPFNIRDLLDIVQMHI